MKFLITMFGINVILPTIIIAMLLLHSNITFIIIFIIINIVTNNLIIYDIVCKFKWELKNENNRWYTFLM